MGYFRQLPNIQTLNRTKNDVSIDETVIIKNLFRRAKIRDDIVDVVNRTNFQYNTRIIKFILNLDEETFSILINNISIEKRDELFHLAISNNYHQITEYQNNIEAIKIV